MKKIKTVKWILRILIVVSLCIGYLSIIRDIYIDPELFALMWECFGIPLVFLIGGLLLSVIVYFGMKFIWWVFSNDEWREL
jgi:hypothetical protein